MKYNNSHHQKKQLQVIQQLEQKVQNNTASFSLVSPVDDYESDNRICLTSVHLPSHELIQKIQSEIVQPLQKRFPEHYYYQDNSLHMTIKNIRVVNDPPLFSQEEIETSKIVFQEVIPLHQRFQVCFHKLFLFPSNLALFGTTDPELDNIHLHLDKKLGEAGVQDDKNYMNDKYFFANMTLARFRGPISTEFVDAVKHISDSLQFKPYTVDSVSLVSSNAVLKQLKKYGEWKLL